MHINAFLPDNPGQIEKKMMNHLFLLHSHITFPVAGKITEEKALSDGHRPSLTGSGDELSAQEFQTT